ncbi:MAG TPA: two-component regulator propeller domain-containing protein [Pyrinomonadaceae bacterium]|nr:two-component regulator propeller domain-containing protein [Pyrinomonadaceae bacterium]
MIFGRQPKFFETFTQQAFWLILFCILISAPINHLYAERLPIKTYTVADGLLRDYVDKIKQDSRGFLWFCTGEGISRFDGIGMTNFTVADGLPNREVHDFLETRNGTIYIATESGLARLNPHGLRGSTENPLFTNFLPDNPKAEKILTLYEDKSNQIWVGTSDGLYKLIETGGQITFESVVLGEPLELAGRAIAEPNLKTLSVNSILEDRRGTLWIGTFGSGLFRLLPDGNVRRFVKDKDGFDDDKITALREDRDGRIWMGMRRDEKGGVCILDPADTEKPIRKCYTTKDGLGSNRIRDIFQTSDGQMWLATVPGLCRWQGEGSASVCKTYTAKNDLCDNILTLAEDKDGNLWTGSPCGAKKIARYGFTTYNATDGLNYDHANSIFENSAGELFVTAYPKVDRVISRFNGDNFSLINKLRLPAYVDYHGWGWEQTVRQDSHGAWWIPTGYGLFRSPDNTSFENLARAPLEKQETGAKGLEPFRLFEDSRGDIWMTTVGDANQLLRWERATNTWHDYTSQVGLSQSGIGSAFAEDRQGNIWIGISSEYGISSLIRFSKGEFRVFNQTEGSPAGWIWDLFLDSRGRLWIASTKNGLWRLDDPNSESFGFIKYTVANGLTSNAVTSVTEDAFGRIYVGSWRGVDRLNPDTGQVENFTTADGLPASFVEVSYRDRQNNLWFGTDNGVARFVPEPPRTRQPPTILITNLRVNGESQNVSVLGESAIQNIELNSDQKQISIEFLGLGASLGEKLKYEYRLANSDWTPTIERTVNFANLASDSYQFQVRVMTADRIYSQPATFSFKIFAPIWQRWWFILLATGLIALTIYAFYRNRLARLLEMERIRTRIATDLHDDVGANLTRISLLSEVAKQDRVRNLNTLTSIADIARESVASMNDIVWAIAPEHDSFSDLTRRMRQHAEEIFSSQDIDLYFAAPVTDIDLKLSINVRRDLLLIFKEAVNNASKHSNCTKVWIDFRLENSILKLQIKDNGKGFRNDLESDGQGLRSMTRRAESLEGKINIDSTNGTIIEFEMILH